MIFTLIFAMICATQNDIRHIQWYALRKMIFARGLSGVFQSLTAELTESVKEYMWNEMKKAKKILPETTSKTDQQSSKDKSKEPDPQPGSSSTTSRRSTRLKTPAQISKVATVPKSAKSAKSARKNEPPPIPPHLLEEPTVDPKSIKNLIINIFYTLNFYYIQI